MKRSLPNWCWVWLGALLWLPGADRASAAYVPGAEAGAYAVEVVTGEWTDAAREGRVVPYKAYLPEGLERPAPAVIFSHGLGGTREGYEYLGRYWASHGYVSVHLQHAGSDDAVWRDAPAGKRMDAARRAILDPEASRNRPLDVSFAIDMLGRAERESASPFKGRVDLSRIGMAGHSFGAWTTNAIGGQAAVTPNGLKAVALARDERVKAILPLSSPVPKSKQAWDAAFGAVAVPAMHMTGTKDDSPVGDTKAAERRVPFDHTRGKADGGPGVWLITFDGADHMTFSGSDRFKPGRRDVAALDPTFHSLILRASLAFWDAHLRGDDQAMHFLNDGGLTTMIGPSGIVERK